MKRKHLIVVILILIAVIVFLLQFNINPKKTDTYITEDPQKKETILDIKKQIEEEIAKEQKIKAEQERLIRLQNSELVLSNLNKVAGLKTDVCEGITTYDSVVDESGTIVKKGSEAHIVYHFIIGIDLKLNEWQVAKIEGDVITLNIPKIKPYLKSVEEKEDESYIKDLYPDRKWFVKRHTPSQLEFIKDFAKKYTRNKINNDALIWEKAEEGIESNLETIKQFILELGYSKVNFNEI